ncbi:MAG: L-ribulose-5-phosphate 4-epimerase AraD [Spirochaetales bacterium]|nr:L-ribulose-5-phosphate 4-epimerase AraD [Spirochaetales bacterium]
MKDLRQEAFEANMEIPAQNLAIYTFGNVSAFDPDKGLLAIKPSGVPYDRLTASDMVVVDLEGQIVEGSLRPSSDTATHIELYRAFQGIRGICHTHSTYATAWAQARKPIPILGTTHADHLPADVPVTAVMSDSRIHGNYEKETGRQIIERFTGMDPLEVPMVLVACHGPFTWGSSAQKAVYHAKVLEEIAQMAHISCTVRRHPGRLKKSIITRHYERKHGKNAYYGQT